ncbi:hypothetical protein MUK42_34526 [Musa troglodytarum]|uniref:Uncharacterized protein n=1 Tax=Musa troglodytarum TaxID=320322 RepID=A0A9E7JAN0_9LILI|nr:hypothetical protein MUK42_34526 [Musa troglodytarum]
MVKKSSTSGAASPPPAEKSSNYADNLKTLNQMLLDETMVRRKQVNDLHALLDRLFLASDLERGVTRLVISSRLAEFAAKMAAAKEKEKENDLLISRLKLEAATGDDNSIKQALNEAILERDSALLKLEETKLQVVTAVNTGREVIAKLRSDLEERKVQILALEADKASMVERIGSMEKAPQSGNDQLQLIKGEKGEIENDLERAILETDECKRDLNAMPTALQKTDGSQVSIDAFDETMVKMQHDSEDKTKGFILSSDQCKMEEHREERGILETEIANLQERESELQATWQEEIASDEKLRLAEEPFMKIAMGFVTREKDHLKKALDRAILERDSNQRNATVTEEAEKLTMEIDSSGNEKKILQLDNEGRIGDHVKEADGTVNSLKKITEEKDAIDASRATQEYGIAELQRAMADLQSCSSALREYYGTNTESNAWLQSENARRGLDIEKAEVSGPIVQMEKDDVHGKLQEMKALPESPMAENNDFKKDLYSSTMRMASLEARSTAAAKKRLLPFKLAHGIMRLSFDIEDCEEKAMRQQLGLDDDSDDENIQNIARELVVIKMVSERKMMMIRNMREEIQLLRDAMAEAKNKGALRTWLYPAAATLLAIYLAYAAKR